MAIYTRKCTNSAGVENQEEHYYFFIQPLDIGWIDIWCDCYTGWKVKWVDNYEGELLEKVTASLSILFLEISNWIGGSNDGSDYEFWDAVTNEGKDLDNEIIIYMVRQQLELLPNPDEWPSYNSV